MLSLTEIKMIERGVCMDNTLQILLINDLIAISFPRCKKRFMLKLSNISKYSLGTFV